MQERRREFMKSRDGQLPSQEQLMLLGRMLMDVLNEIRHAGDLCRANELAYAFHNLPVSMHSDWFRWSVLLIALEEYQRQQPDSAERFITQLDHIVGFV